MVDKICNFLLSKIRKEMPDIDDERAEIINYGLQLVIGEVPKTFIMIAIAVILGIWQLAIISFIAIIPYRMFSGGFHLKTHIGCILGTTLFYCGNVYLSKYILLGNISKYIVILAIWMFSIVMIKLYAPADTENVPIISKKDRKFKKNMSYIMMTLTLVVGMFIPNPVISNIVIFGTLLQTLLITRFAYKITNNKYGYEEYLREETQLN